MLGGTGLKGRGVLPAVARQRLTAFPRSSRSVGFLWPLENNWCPAGWMVRVDGRTLINTIARYRHFELRRKSLLVAMEG